MALVVFIYSKFTGKQGRASWEDTQLRVCRLGVEPATAAAGLLPPYVGRLVKPLSYAE